MPVKSKKSKKEIPLDQWAKSKRRSTRTAQEWAKSGLIPARLAGVQETVTTVRTVKKYMIAADAPLPE